VQKQLIFVKPDYTKYTEASRRIFTVLRRYDPDMASASLDEAYMNLVHGGLRPAWETPD
jgi:DNA polymerase kappa